MRFMGGRVWREKLAHMCRVSDKIRYCSFSSIIAFVGIFRSLLLNMSPKID